MSGFKFKQGRPKDEKMNETILAGLNKRIGKEKILSCLILKNNSLIFEHYKNNKISDSLQTINSCTKSVISALIGVLLDRGFHMPITDFFSGIINNQIDERLKGITI